MDTDALIERLASELGIPDGTVRKWRSRGKVPHHMRHKLAELARENYDFILRTPAFDNFGKSQANAA